VTKLGTSVCDILLGLKDFTLWLDLYSLPHRPCLPFIGMWVSDMFRPTIGSLVFPTKAVDHFLRQRFCHKARTPKA
jgi:hypothetical protein